MGTKATDVIQLIDIDSKTLVNYQLNPVWYDGSPVTDERCEGDIFRKVDEGKYARKMIDFDLLLKINSISDLRSTNGYYEGQTIDLLGYYVAGDKATVKYKFTAANFGTLVDDGGAVIKASKGSWIAQFDNTFIDVKDFGIRSSDVDSLAAWLKLNDYCTRFSKSIYLSIDVSLVFPTTTNIDTVNIKGNNTLLTLDGKVSFLTTNLTNVDISDFNVYVKNNYTTLASINNSTTIFYNPIAVYNVNRKVSYRNLTCTVEAPSYDGSNRLAGFIRDGSYDKGVYSNITVNNVSLGVASNGSQSSHNNVFEDITAYNFGTAVWAQGESQVCNNIRGINTPIQATNWVNKTLVGAPRGVNGLDVVLAEGNGLDIKNIHAENPIERSVYVQCNNVTANNIYSLNGDGVKFVGQSYSSICKNIYINNVVLEFDSTSMLTFNITAFQIYWVDNYNINNVTINNSNTTTDQILTLYSFKRTAKNVKISNVTMKGRGCVSSVGDFSAHETETVGTVPYENIEIENVSVIKSRNRHSSTFNHYLTTPTETLIRNIKISKCYINYEKVSENGDDFLYRFDWVDGFNAYGNSSNVRGQWVGGFPSSAPLGTYSNVLIQEDNLKATNIETNITAMNQGMNLVSGSYLNFEISKGNTLKSVFKGSGLNYLEWKVDNNVNNIITATNRTITIDTVTKTNGFTSCQIITNVKTAITGTVPTTLVNYTDGGASLSVRGDTFSGSYTFRAKIFL